MSGSIIQLVAKTSPDYGYWNCRFSNLDFKYTLIYIDTKPDKTKRGNTISEGEIRLDIGCSYHKLPGWLGIDIEKGSDADVIADIHRLPFKDSSIDEIHSRHTLEHVANPLDCISEMFRVTRNNGKITIIVPHYSNNAYWSDVTHLRPFGARAFEYFDIHLARQSGFPLYLPDVNLRTRTVSLTWWPERIYCHKSFLKRTLLKSLNAIINRMANMSPFLCERLWCFWVGGFYEVTFELQPVKETDSF